VTAPEDEFTENKWFIGAIIGEAAFPVYKTHRAPPGEKGLKTLERLKNSNKPLAILFRPDRILPIQGIPCEPAQ
jgi:hypothetical protein